MYVDPQNLIKPQQQNITQQSHIYVFWYNVMCIWHRRWCWRHQMETFSALLAFCPVTVEFPSQRPVMRSFDVFFDLCLNKRLSKQPWGWWFETRWRSLWRHCNIMFNFICRTSYGFAKNICYISSLLHMLRRLMKTCLVSYSYFSSDFFLNVEQTEPRHWSYLVDELWQEMCLYHRDMLSLVRLSFFW